MRRKCRLAFYDPSVCLTYVHAPIRIYMYPTYSTAWVVEFANSSILRRAPHASSASRSQATAWESLLSGELADALGPTLAVHRG